MAAVVVAHAGNRQRSKKLTTTGRTASLHADLIGEEAEANRWLEKKDSVLAKHAVGSGFLAAKESRVLKQGKIFKLTSTEEWVEKMVAVTQTQMTLSTTAEKKEDVLQDYIPLHEIQKVSFTGLSHEESNISIEGAPGEAKTPSFRHQWSTGMHKMSHRKNGQTASTGNTVDNGVMFEIHTSADGSTAGRVYSFKTNSSEECTEWVALLSSQSVRRSKEIRKRKIIQYYRDKVALLITASFAANAYQAEYHPETLQSDDGEAAEVYSIIDVCLTSAFVLELSFNIFAHWFWAFVLDGWNLFDFGIVGLSVISLLVPSLPGLSFLRVLRAFRVLRLIRRFRSLKRIFDALVLSIIPVLNAFSIGVLITFIYTIMGVFLFASYSFQDFGTFNRSLTTLFMLVNSGDWPEALPLLREDGYLDKVVFAYLLSFVAVVVWTCLQVVVAVLLDNFLSVTSEDKRNEAIREQHESRKAGSPLEPLLKKLAVNFDAPDDLLRDIECVFHMLDIDDSGSLSDNEMLAGFSKLKLTPKIVMTADECKAIKTHTLGCGDDAELSLDLFESLMLTQLRDYVQRSLHDAFVMNQGDPQAESMIAAMKLVLVQDARGTSMGPGDGRRIAELQEQMAVLRKEVKSEMAVLRDEVQSLPQRIAALLSNTPGAPTSANWRTAAQKHHAAPAAMHDALDSAASIAEDAVHLVFPEHASPDGAPTSFPLANPPSTPNTRAGSVSLVVSSTNPVSRVQSTRPSTPVPLPSVAPDLPLVPPRPTSQPPAAEGKKNEGGGEQDRDRLCWWRSAGAWQKGGGGEGGQEKQEEANCGATPQVKPHERQSRRKGRGVHQKAPSSDHNGSTNSSSNRDISTKPSVEAGGGSVAEEGQSSNWLSAATPRSFLQW